MQENIPSIPRSNPSADDFADLISALRQKNPARNCPTCHNKKYDGIVTLPDGVRKLNICHCSDIGETEYTRLQRRILSEFEQIKMSLVHQQETLFRNTFWGGLRWRWWKVAGFFKRVSHQKPTTAGKGVHQPSVDTLDPNHPPQQSGGPAK